IPTLVLLKRAWGVCPRPPAHHPPPFHPRAPQKSVGHLSSPTGPPSTSLPPPRSSKERGVFVLTHRPPSTSHSHPRAPQKSVGRSCSPAGPHPPPNPPPVLLKRAWGICPCPPAHHPPPFHPCTPQKSVGHLSRKSVGHL